MHDIVNRDKLNLSRYQKGMFLEKNKQENM